MRKACHTQYALELKANRESPQSEPRDNCKNFRHAISENQRLASNAQGEHFCYRRTRVTTRYFLPNVAVPPTNKVKHLCGRNENGEVLCLAAVFSPRPLQVSECCFPL